ncbi:MAG: lysophospholipid acyltransferase family protein [Candidatus Omnitrophota bacterium]|nr:lysophospholipid acyltransferase family protein [Candidatus Omnitrophota bacterium]
MSLWYTVTGWLCAMLLTIGLSLWGIVVCLPFSLICQKGSRASVHGISLLWADLLLFFNPAWRIRLEGNQLLDHDGPFVIIANHQSLLDILIVCAGLKRHFKFLAKKELFPIPFMGWHMFAAGYIPLRRGDRESARAALEEARQWLRRGVSVLFFPEGTRSLDGEIHDFKPGAFKLAREEGVDVLPLVIDRTGTALPKHSIMIRRKTDFWLSIGKPVSVVDGKDRLDAIRLSVRAEMADRLHNIRSREETPTP